MKPGTKQKPHNLNIINGNPGKRNINIDTPEPRGDKPSCPSWVQGYARDIWKRLIDDLYRMKVVTYDDRDIFAVYCTLMSAYRDAVVAKDTKEMRLVASQVRICAAELGLTPSARGGLQVPKDDSKKDSKRKKLFG